MDTITIPQLSAAIRKDGYPQARHQFIRLKKSGEVMAACALGQAALNLGYTGFGQTGFTMQIEEKAARCPVRKCQIAMDMNLFPVETVIIHLNDDHQWKLGRIADWLDTL